MCNLFPNLKQCCFCISLRRSTIGLACLYTFMSIPLLVLYGAPLFMYAPMDDSTRYFFYLAFLSLVPQLLTGCLLIYAAIRKYASLMFPWVLVSFCQSAALVVLAMVCSSIYIYKVTRREIYDDPEEATTYTVYALYGFLLYYATAVVNSYRKQVIEEKRSARAARSEDDQVENLPLRDV